MYCERQRGDLCRVHSINNWFGSHILSEYDFINYCNEYDGKIKGLKSINMDGFAEGRSIVSYIMDVKFNKFVMLIPLNSYSNSRKHIDLNHYKNMIRKLNYYFEFNKGHIWVNKKINGYFYKFDSITGINMTYNNGIGNNGYLLIIDNYNLYEEIEYIISIIKKYNTIKEEYEISYIIYIMH